MARGLSDLGILGLKRALQAQKEQLNCVFFTIKCHYYRSMPDFGYLFPVKILAQPKSKLSEINKQLGKPLEIQVAPSAFHPSGEQQVLSLIPEIFSVLRTSSLGTQDGGFSGCAQK